MKHKLNIEISFIGEVLVDAPDIKSAISYAMRNMKAKIGSVETPIGETAISDLKVLPHAVDIKFKKQK